MSYRVCVDASLALLWLLPAQRTGQAVDLLEQWTRDGTDLIGPPLFDAEVTSAIRMNVYMKRLIPEEGEEAYESYAALGVEIVSPPGLSRYAWELAKEYNLPRTYDMQYLALAELEGCEFWTGDRKLINALQDKAKRIKWIGEYAGKPDNRE